MKIQAFFRNVFDNKRITLFLFFIIGFFVFSLEQTFANEASNLGETFIEILNGGLKIAASVLGLLTAFVSLFLYPGWVNGTIFGLQEYLKEMWILISNVVYFVFAFILIVIAFMNIIGKGDKWELKSALPRFIIGVLIVPFSWFFVQFVLSVSAVLTVGVLTLPYDMFQDKDFFSEIDSEIGPSICTHMEVYLGSEGAGGGTGGGGASDALGEFIHCEEGSKKTIGQILNGDGEGDEAFKNSIFGIASIYTYGVLSIDGLDTLTQGQLNAQSGITALLDLGLKGIFDIIFVIMYLILMAALFLALFTRGIWLWMYAMFSPAFGLLYFFEKGKEGVGGENKFSITEFISLAMVPVYVSAALSFGLVFLFVASQGLQNEATTENGESTTLELGGFRLTIFGEQGSGETGLSTLARLIIQIFGLAMLWIAVMAALKQSSVTERITKPIADFGNSVGSLVASAPMYAPIIPGGNGQMMSARGLQNFGSTIRSTIDSHYSGEGTQAGQRFAGNLGFGDTPTARLQRDMARVADGISNGDLGARQQGFETLSDRSLSDLASDRRLREQYVQYLRDIFGDDFTDAMQAGIMRASNQDDLAQQLATAFNGLRGTHGSVVNEVFSPAVHATIDARTIREVMGGETPAAPETPETSPINISLAQTSSIEFNPDGTLNGGIDGLRNSIGTSNITAANREIIRGELRDLQSDDGTPRFTQAEITAIMNELYSSTD